MGEETKPAAETAPAEAASISNIDALASAGVFFETIESYLLKKQVEADKLGTHGEFAGLRGNLASCLNVWRSGKPGGVLSP